MRRIEACFSALQTAGKKALIPFITAGYPQPDQSVPLMHTLVRAGVDIIELGIPFSDPMADGPTIQRASELALQQGVRLQDVMAMVSEFRQENSKTPVVLMGYANPVEAMGVKAFAAAAAQAGVDGVLIVDYPPEEAATFAMALKEVGLDLIFQLAPTSQQERIEHVATLASGYIYYVALSGVTGSHNLNIEQIAQRLPAIRQTVRVPVGVGFGIRDADSARRVACLADAVVVGSRIIECIEQAAGKDVCEHVYQLAAELRHGVDAAA